jgi:hypothetical protein
MATIITISLVVLFGVFSNEALAEGARYDEGVCGSSRLRLSSREELASTTLTDDRRVAGDLETDLTGDGLSEYLSASQCGQAGCEYAIFLQERVNEYRCAGEVNLHKDAFIRLTESRHNEFFDLLVYSRDNAERGSLLRLEFDGRRYKLVHRVDGKASDLFPLIRVPPQAAEPKDRSGQKTSQ